MPVINIDGLISNLDTSDIISKLLEIQRQPIKILRSKQTTLTSKLTAYQEANTRLLALKLSADALGYNSTVRAAASSSSDETILRATASFSANVGTYNLQSLQLARANKLSTVSFADATSALNLSGDILINGKKVVVESNDTLVSLQGKINQANAGVTASMLTLSPSDKRLILTANATGVDNRIQMSDVGSGTVLQSLGLTTSSSVEKHSAVTGSAVAGPFTLDGTNDQLALTLGGAQRTVTLSHVAGVSGASLAAAMETDINNAFAADRKRVRVTYDSGATQFTITHDGASLTVDAAASNDARATLGLAAATRYVGSDRFSDSTTAVGALLSLSSPPSGTVQINGTNVALNLAADSLTAIKSAIDAAAPSGVTTSIVSVTDSSGATQQELRLSGVTSFTDSDKILSILGLINYSPANELTAAQDAQVEIDNLRVTQPSNTITDLVPGVTLGLQSVPSTPKTVLLQVKRDTAAIKKAINEFVEQFNKYIAFVKEKTDFNPEINKGEVLVGETDILSITDQVTSAITAPVRGLSTTLNTLTQVGVTLGTDGKLTVDDATLTGKLSSDPDGVGKLFQVSGTTSNADITFIAQSSKTKASTTAGYLIDITQVAQKASATAGTAQTAAGAQDETLTFSGALFNNLPYTLHLPTGNTLTQTVNQINNDPTLKQKLVASAGEGRLVLTSRDYGSAQSFTVVSSRAAASDNSGVGTTPLSGAGVDVQGTINGESATGVGQRLTGNLKNANTEGLQIKVTATTTGLKGVVVLSKGISGVVSETLNFLTEGPNGQVVVAQDAIKGDIKEIEDEISSLEGRIAISEAQLRDKFSRLEKLLGRFQAQSAIVGQQLVQLRR